MLEQHVQSALQLLSTCVTVEYWRLQ